MATTSRFAEPPVFEIVGTVALVEPPAELLAALGSAGPAQARAPKGTSIGGQWIETVKGILNSIMGFGTPDSEAGGSLVETTEAMERPTLTPGEIATLRKSAVSGQHIDENGEWTPERKAEQERIVNEFLDGVEAAPPGEAVVYFNGGGPGSGKGSFTSGAIDAGYPPTRGVNDATGEMDFEGMPNPGAVLIDPDSIKMQLPEVKAMRESQRLSGDMANRDGGNGGGDWANQSHEESSYIAKMVYAEAIRRNLPIVYDGTGTKIVGKAQQALDGGYKEAKANYMYVEPQEALVSAIDRAGRIGRNVPKDRQAGQYAEMAEAFETTAGKGIFSEVNLYDRNGVAKGEVIPKIFEIRNGKRHVIDQAAYDRFLSSGDRLPDLSGV